MSQAAPYAALYYNQKVKKWVVDVYVPPTRKTFKTQKRATQYCQSNNIPFKEAGESPLASSSGSASSSSGGSWSISSLRDLVARDPSASASTSEST